MGYLNEAERDIYEHFKLKKILWSLALYKNISVLWELNWWENIYISFEMSYKCKFVINLLSVLKILFFKFNEN